MDKPVIIIGASGIGRTALEIFESNGVVVFGFLDDDPSLHGREIMNVSVLGSTTDESILKLIGVKCEAFIASDNNNERKSMVDMLKERRHVMPVNAIHPFARIAASAHIEHGIFINDLAIIGSNSRIRSHTIIHSGAVIDFDTSLGQFVQVGPGSVIGNGVKIEDQVFIGAGATIIPGVTVGKKARIGAGSVVVENIEENETVFGNPAKSISI
jgi:sugar O-acyltransferase (sialic acid O-acetyltransferase NeuD family)